MKQLLHDRALREFRHRPEVTIGSVFVWKGNRSAVVLSTIVGGLAHLGYSIFVVLPGHAPVVGVAMTFIMVAAVVLGLAANIRSSGRAG